MRQYRTSEAARDGHEAPRTLIEGLRAPASTDSRLAISMQHEMCTFSPLAALLPDRVTTELFYLEAKFVGLTSYGIF